MKAAVVFYSMNGNTAFAARKAAQALEADLIEIAPEKKYPDKGFRKFFWGGKSAIMSETPALKPYEFNAGLYDLVVLGFPVWAGNMTPPMRTFARDNREALRGRRVCAFACQSGSGAEKAFKKLEDCLGGALSAQLILIDPKDKPSAENDAKIAVFCELCRRG